MGQKMLATYLDDQFILENTRITSRYSQGWRKVLVWQALLNLLNGRLWQVVVDISNIGMAAAIPCHQVPPPLALRNSSGVRSGLIDCVT